MNFDFGKYRSFQKNRFYLFRILLYTFVLGLIIYLIWQKTTEKENNISIEKAEIEEFELEIIDFEDLIEN